jgi:phosphoglycolate phosphatase-like HAD superfamily hydrolase
MRYLKISFIVILSSIGFAAHALPQNNIDPLPSWNEQSLKKDVITFVQRVVDSHDPNYVAPADRIAVFDNDGTMWVEQPAYTQVIFAIDKIKLLAPKHPEWKAQQPFKTILSGDAAAMSQLSLKDYEQMIAVTHAGMSVGDFHAEVKSWLENTTNAHFKKPYIKLIYQPMLEMMRYLRANNFKIYIVTGGGQEFVRAYSEVDYSVPSEQVIGTAAVTKYDYRNGSPVLIKLPKVLFVDDGAGKPEAINLFIGKKPIIAFGNSDGDRQMLKWTQSNHGLHFMALVHHDDAEREYSYGPKSKIGTFSDSLMTEANQQGWHVISMKQDWKVVFP